MAKKETPKKRLIRQFKDNRPLGMNVKEDLEDFEQEIELMIAEGLDLSEATVRGIIKRMGGGLRE